MIKHKSQNNTRRFLTTIVILALILSIIFLAIYIIKHSDNKANAEQETAIVQLQQQVIELNKNVNSLLIVVEEKDYQISYMTVALDEAEDELSEKNIAIVTLSNEITRKNSEIDRLTSDNQIKSAEVERLSSENAEFQIEVERLRLEVEANEERIAELEQLIEANQAEIERLDNEIKNQNVHISELALKVEQLKTENETLTERYNLISETVAGYTDSITALQSDVENINKQISKIQSQIQTINASIDALKLNRILDINVGEVDSGNNFVLFKNGLLIQWGWSSLKSNGTVTVQMAKMYQSKNHYAVIASINRDSASGSGLDGVYVSQSTDKSFLLTHDYTSTSHAGGGAFWLAIGQAHQYEIM